MARDIAALFAECACACDYQSVVDRLPASFGILLLFPWTQCNILVDLGRFSELFMARGSVAIQGYGGG